MRIGIIIIVWLSAAVLGFVHLWSYECTPGLSGTAPKVFPACRLKLSGQTLFLFLHPRCPCSEATMDCVQQLKVHRVAVFACPAGQTAAWCHGPLWDQTVASGFEAVCDPGGTESTRFGALTSGHAVVYSAEGKLQFSGGLTSTRGHVGPSAGSVALEGLLHGEAGVDRFTPTYGCEMCGPCKRNH